MPPRSKSSHQWLKEHFNDPYVKQSWVDGYRSRAAYKLLEIQKRDHIFKPGMTVVDLGAAPGSWTQVLKQFVGRPGKIIAMDILPIEPIEGVTIIEGDFTAPEVYEKLLAAIDQAKVDAVISDMAPNMSGNKGVDQLKAMYLIDLAVDFAKQTLKPGGTLLMKVFHGEGFDDLLKELKKNYGKVVVRKPDASRDRSREQYILATGFRS